MPNKISYFESDRFSGIFDLSALIVFDSPLYSMGVPNVVAVYQSNE